MNDKPIGRVEVLAEAGPMRRTGVVGSLVVGIVLAAAEILLFDWEPGEMVAGALLGTCAWGALYYFTDAAKLVPRGAVVPGVPFGYGAASLLALVQIRHWENANGRRVLFEPDSDDPRPYAGLPL